MYRADTPLQLLKIEVVEGRNIRIIGLGASAGYDEESRVLSARGGGCVLFAYGFTPSLFDPAHVTVKMYTSAFTGEFSTRKGGTQAEAAGGHRVSFLEKTRAEWGTKCVLLVT